MARHFTQVEAELPGTASVLLLGAIAGLALSYLYFTEHGRQARSHVERILERLAFDLARLSKAAHALAAASIDQLDAMETRIAEFSRIVRK